jgi:hypothetical protein
MKIFLLTSALLSIVFFSSCDNSDKNSNVSSANDWTNAIARQQYKDVAAKTCSTLSPQYFCLGIEVNTYYAYNPADFARFVSLYKEIYDSIKNTNPTTKVFVSFQLERMKGLGIAVGYSGTAQWDILSQFDGKLDLIAFTSYPEVEYLTPGGSTGIPDNYYSEITSHLPANLSGKKIALTETGWNSSVNILTGSSNTYQSQIDFITRLETVTSTLKNAGQLEFITWAFMHDMKDTGVSDPFISIGLRNADGSAKGVSDDVWNRWISFKTTIGSSFKTGIGPVPKNFPGSDSSDWLDMFNNVPNLGSLILTQTDWKDSLAKAGDIPQLFIDINNTRSYHKAEPVYGISFFDLATGEAKISK